MADRQWPDSLSSIDLAYEPEPDDLYQPCEHGLPDPASCEDCYHDSLAQDAFQNGDVGKRLLYTVDDLIAFGRAYERGLKYLPLLGEEGYIVEGWTTLVAAGPKVGKTELLVRCAAGWPRTLFISEEPAEVWYRRFQAFREAGLPFPTDGAFVIGVGEKPSTLLELVALKDYPVVVLDSTQLLGIEDTWRDSEVTMALHRWIAKAHDYGKTLIFLHHVRKSGGKHGDAVAGSFAFLAAVDTLLEIHHVKDDESLRELSCTSRVIASEPFRYRLREDGGMEIVDGDDRETKILEALGLYDEGGLTIERLAELTEMPTSTVYRRIRGLMVRNVVVSAHRLVAEHGKAAATYKLA